MQGFAVLILGVLFVFASPVFADDTKLTCRQIEQELNALESASGEPVINEKTINAGANVATQAAAYSGYGREAGLVSSIFRLFGAMSPSKPAEPKLTAETQKRIARLETIAEMKDCYEPLQ